MAPTQKPVAEWGSLQERHSTFRARVRECNGTAVGLTRQTSFADLTATRLGATSSQDVAWNLKNWLQLLTESRRRLLQGSASRKRVQQPPRPSLLQSSDGQRSATMPRSRRLRDLLQSKRTVARSQRLRGLL